MRILDRIRGLFRKNRRDAVAIDGDAERRAPVMESEVNYFGLASVLIDQHGRGARAEAVRLRQEAIDEGDAEATADWLAVEQAVVLLNQGTGTARH